MMAPPNGKKTKLDANTQLHKIIYMCIAFGEMAFTNFVARKRDGQKHRTFCLHQTSNDDSEGPSHFLTSKMRRIATGKR